MLAREDLKCNFREFSYTHTKVHQEAPRSLLDAHRRCTQVWLRRFSRTGCTSTLPCTATTRHPATRTTSTLPCAATTRRPVAQALLRLWRASRHVVSPLVVGYSASRRLVVGYSASRRLVVDYFVSAACPGASARRAARHAARRAARRRLHRASGCLGTSRSSLRRSSSTTSPSPRVRVPRRVARLVVDYSASPRLVVDYSTARPGASARRMARHAARRAARRRLHRASGCLGTSRGSSRGSLRRLSSTTSPSPRVRMPRHVARLVVDYSASPRLVVDYSTARPGASARRAARHAARRAARRRLLRLAQARRRLLHRASGCLGTSRGSSRG
jgi:hypothetical protein